MPMYNLIEYNESYEKHQEVYDSTARMIPMKT